MLFYIPGRLLHQWRNTNMSVWWRWSSLWILTSSVSRSHRPKRERWCIHRVTSSSSSSSILVAPLPTIPTLRISAKTFRPAKDLASAKPGYRKVGPSRFSAQPHRTQGNKRGKEREGGKGQPHFRAESLKLAEIKRDLSIIFVSLVWRYDMRFKEIWMMTSSAPFSTAPSMLARHLYTTHTHDCCHFLVSFVWNLTDVGCANIWLYIQIRDTSRKPTWMFFIYVCTHLLHQTLSTAGGNFACFYKGWYDKDMEKIKDNTLLKLPSFLMKLLFF